MTYIFQLKSNFLSLFVENIYQNFTYSLYMRLSSNRIHFYFTFLQKFTNQFQISVKLKVISATTIDHKFTFVDFKNSTNWC